MVHVFFSVTVGKYFTHLMKYDDGRFAWHPRFRFFAFNTEMKMQMKLVEFTSDNILLKLTSLLTIFMI